MKNLLCGLFALICIPMFAAQPLKDKQQNDKKSVVPTIYLNAMSKADSLTFLLIDPWSESRQDWMNGYGEVLAKQKCTDKAIEKECLKLLTDPASFDVNAMVKECEFMPDMAIIFHTKKGDVTVAYSTYCDLCRFAKSDNEYADFDGETIRLSFLQLMAKAYPKDRYLRHLIKQTRNNMRK